MELSNVQKQLIARYKSGTFNHFGATPEEQVAFMEIIDAAEALLEELDAYDEFGDDLILWFCNKKGI